MARASGRLGIDTEFMSEGRYFALLCVVQVAVEDAGGAIRTEVLDALDDRLDPAPLAEVLADPDVEIVMHAGGQDVPILRREWKTEVRNIFDTQVAAAFTGVGAQLGFGRLLDQMLGVKLDKSASFTRWDVRPLTQEQVEYARGDVDHLLALTDAIAERLEQTGRLEWAREECRYLEQVGADRDPEEVYKRLPRSGGMRPKARAVVRELAAWRERTAREENKPVSSVLPDHVLVEAAKRAPTDVGQLESIRGVHQGIVRKRGQDIVAAVSRGQAAEPPPTEDDSRANGVSEDTPVALLAEALIRTRAREAGLAYELVASRAELTALVTTARAGEDEPSVRTLQGWRRELVGDEVLELLSGRRSLSVGADSRLRVAEADGGSAGP